MNLSLRLLLWKLSVRMFVQHHFNAVNVYAKLCRVMPREKARKISRVYEKIIHPLIYR